MKKQELLKIIDDELLEKLFGFCYARTNDSYEAQELCSDIIFALIKAANTDGEIDNLYPFVWSVARNVHADFSSKRRRQTDLFYAGDPEEVLPFVANAEREDNSDELLSAVYRRISFLTKAYREVMIMFYIDGLSTAQIAKRLNTSEGAVRQRLFSAGNKVRDEVKNMAEICKPVPLDKIDYVIWGDGNPAWGDPRNVCSRMFSKHIIWLCHKKAMSALEIAEKLNVPTVYIEEELEILSKGENGKYGLLRRLDNGKYAINFILFDKNEMEKANAIYTEHMPTICGIISDYIEEHKEDYLALPYFNRKVDLNLILWQQIFNISQSFSENVERILSEKYFADTEETNRPFSVFGHVDNGKYYGCGRDTVNAENVCGYKKIYLANIYFDRIKKHFGCGLNVASDAQIQMALRAVKGLDIASLSEVEKEHAAKAVECGYLYREENILYTKILVNEIKDMDRLFDISNRLSKGHFEPEAQVVAEKIFDLIRNTVPNYLLGEWRFANRIADISVFDSLVEALIEKGILAPPEGGAGAEGCWICVSN